MNEILQYSATRQASLVRQRQVSSRELVAAHLNRIAEVDPKLHATVEVLTKRALAEADGADAALARGEALGPLGGVPFSIKDSLELAGTVCTAGTLGRSGAAPSTEDATLVARLRRAGGIPIARTNLPDLLFAFESDNLLFGRTNNPYDVNRTCGGSSDCAGSVRLPAAFCGIAGIKPTSGRLPRTGHFPPAGGWIEALWQIGPMARRVEDLATVMPLLAAPDECDPTAIGMPAPDPAAVSLRGLRAAFYTDNGFAAAHPEVAEVVRAAARWLAAETACMDETRPALLTGWLDKLEPYRTDLAGLEGYWAEWDAYRAGMFAFLRRYDVIVAPAYTQPALPHGASVRDENFRGFSHTMAYNVAGWPAAVVRCGESAGGLPIAVQVVAGPWREDRVLAVASVLEQAFGGWKAPKTL